MNREWCKVSVPSGGLRIVAWTILLGWSMGFLTAIAEESPSRVGSAENQLDETGGGSQLTGPAGQPPTAGPPGGSEQELTGGNTFRRTFVVSGEPLLLQAVQTFHKGPAIRARVEREVPELNVLQQPRFLMRPLGQQSLACGVAMTWEVAERQSVSAVERQEIEERLTGIVRDMLEKEIGRLNDLLILPQLKQASINRERLQAEIDQLSVEMEREEVLLNEQLQRRASLEMTIDRSVPDLQKRVLDGQMNIIEQTAKLEAVLEHRSKLMMTRDEEQAVEAPQLEGDAEAVFRQLQSIAELREESLRRAEGLFHEGTVSNSSLTELKIKAAEARLQVAQFVAQHRRSGRESERLDRRISELSVMAEGLELEVAAARRSLEVHEKSLRHALDAADQLATLTRELAKREATWKRANDSREELRAKLRKMDAELNQPRLESRVEELAADLVP